VVGRERYPLGDRTRTGLRLVEKRLAGADGLGGNRVSLESLRRLVYRAETVIGESIREDVVRDCRTQGDLRAACDALQAWNGSARPEARGGALAREFIELLPHESRSSGMSLVESSWRVPFDRMRPIETPAGLMPSDATRRALAQAAHSLQIAGIAADAPLRDVQFLTLGGQRVPLGGFTYTFLRYLPVPSMPRSTNEPIYTYGDSYIHAVTFDDHGPVADIALAYSQSTDPQSEHSWDLTLAYAQQRWIRLPFLDRDIRADPGYRLVELQSNN
jgi:acyl-homoserine-lactone acylase